MLVLTRKVNETIAIGNDIEITVTHIGGMSVRLGITAPDNINIARSELLKATDPSRDVGK